MARQLAAELASQPLTHILHSGVIRTRVLAEMIGRQAATCVRCDPRWAERDFGAWEGRSWHAIWRETGSLMDRMMTDPAGFRPGGGETGLELMQRVQAALDDLGRDVDTLVIAHGGSIAAARVLAAGAPAERMIDYIPAHGEIVVIDQH